MNSYSKRHITLVMILIICVQSNKVFASSNKVSTKVVTILGGGVKLTGKVAASGVAVTFLAAAPLNVAVLAANSIKRVSRFVDAARPPEQEAVRAALIAQWKLEDSGASLGHAKGPLAQYIDEVGKAALCATIPTSLFGAYLLSKIW